MKNKNVIVSRDIHKLTLLEISRMGDGLKPEIIDWSNIGKNAVRIAKQVLAEKCKKCGKVL